MRMRRRRAGDREPRVEQCSAREHLVGALSRTRDATPPREATQSRRQVVRNGESRASARLSAHRGARIRTGDLTDPNGARYQAAPRPEGAESSRRPPVTPSRRADDLAGGLVHTLVGAADGLVRRRPWSRSTASATGPPPVTCCDRVVDAAGGVLRRLAHRRRSSCLTASAAFLTGSPADRPAALTRGAAARSRGPPRRSPRERGCSRPAPLRRRPTWHGRRRTTSRCPSPGESRSRRFAPERSLRSSVPAREAAAAESPAGAMTAARA